MGVWDEKPPVPLSNDPNNPATMQGFDPKRALLAQLMTMSAPRGGGGGEGGGTPARVGGPPPQMQSTTTPSGMPIPGLAPMSAAQAGGPAARYPTSQPEDAGREFRSPRARDAAVVQNAMSGISNAVVQFKQQRFEKEAAQTAQITTTLMQSALVQDKINRGEPISPQDLETAAQAAKMDPKVIKLFEKAMKDPMSGAYVGIQRAYQQQQANIAQQAEVDYKRAQAEELRARGKYYETANPTKENVAGIQAGTKLTTAQNELMSKNMIKGLHTEFDAQGRAQVRPFTNDEVEADPMLKALRDKEIALTNASVARTKQGAEKLAIDRERLNFQRHKLEVDAQLKREAIAQRREAAGQKSAGVPKLSTEDKSRISQALMAEDYLSKMQDIVKRRPDLFGPGGWSGNAFKKAYGEQDPDAINFKTYGKFAAQPMVGVHKSRSMQLVRDMDDFNSSIYQNPDTTLTRLSTERDAMEMAIGQIRKAASYTPMPAGADASGGKVDSGGAKGGSITIGSGANAITISPKSN